MSSRNTLALIVLGLIAASCAKVGNLDRPAPLVGAKAKAQYQAQQRAAAEAKTKKVSKEPEALPADEAEPSMQPTTARPTPAEGEHPSPFGQPLPGVIPDPFNSPQ